MANIDEISRLIDDKIHSNNLIIRAEIAQLGESLNNQLDQKFNDFQLFMVNLLNNAIPNNISNIPTTNNTTEPQSVSGESRNLLVDDTKQILKVYPIHPDLPIDDDDDANMNNKDTTKKNNVTTSRSSNGKSATRATKSILADKFRPKPDTISREVQIYTQEKEFIYPLKELTVNSVLKFLHEAHKFEKTNNRISRNVGRLDNISEPLRIIISSKLFVSPSGPNIILPDDTIMHVTSSRFDSMTLVELACVLESCFPSYNANEFLSFIETGIASFKVDLSRTFPSLNNWEEHLLPPLIEYLDRFQELYMFLFPRFVGASKDRPKIEPPKNIQNANSPNLLFLFLSGFPYEFLFNLYNNYLKSTNWNSFPDIEANDMTKFIVAIKDHIKVFNKLCMDARTYNKLFSGESVKSIKSQIITTYKRNSIVNNRIAKSSNNSYSNNRQSNGLAAIEHSDSDNNSFVVTNPNEIPFILSHNELGQFNNDYNDEDMQRAQFDYAGKKSFTYEQALITNEGNRSDSIEDSASDYSTTVANINSKKPNSNEEDEVCYKAAFSPTGVCDNPNCIRLHKGPKYETFIRNTHRNLTSQVQKLNSNSDMKSPSIFVNNKPINDPHYKSILKKQVASINNVSVENEHMNAYQKMIVNAFLGNLNLHISSLREDIMTKLIIPISICFGNSNLLTIKLLIDTGNFALPIIYADSLRNINPADMVIRYVNNRLLLPNGIWMTADKEVELVISIEFKGQTYMGRMNFVLVENIDSRTSPFNAIIGLFSLIYQPTSPFLQFARAVFQDITDFISSQQLNAVPCYEYMNDRGIFIPNRPHSNNIPSSYSMLSSLLLPSLTTNSNVNIDDEDEFDFLSELDSLQIVPSTQQSTTVLVTTESNNSLFSVKSGGASTTAATAECENLNAQNFSQFARSNGYIISTLLSDSVSMVEDPVISDDEDIISDSNVFGYRNN